MTAIHTTMSGHGPRPVVFLHGLFGRGRNFATIAQGLDSVATSLLVDLPNHGESEWTDSINIDEWADLIIDRVRDFSSDPVTVIGHSLGGKVGMRMALSHPDVVGKLLVADMSPVDYPPSREFPHLIESMRALDLGDISSRRDADERLSEQIHSRQVRSFLLQNLQRAEGSWRWQANLELLHSEIARVSEWPATDAQFQGPVLWVGAERSDYVLDEYQPAMEQLFPQVQNMTVKDAGHWLHADQTEVFTNICRWFITKK